MKIKLSTELLLALVLQAYGKLENYSCTYSEIWNLYDPIRVSRTKICGFRITLSKQVFFKKYERLLSLKGSVAEGGTL